MKRSSQTLAAVLKEKALTIAFAESITCGLAAHWLGSVSHTSDFFKGSIVCYDEAVKTGLLKIPKAVIKKNTAESQQVTDMLAKRLYKLLKADVSVAVTGLASHGGSESKTKPVGTVFYAVYYKGLVYSSKKQFNGTPLEVKKKACREMYAFTARTLTARA